CKTRFTFLIGIFATRGSFACGCVRPCTFENTKRLYRCPCTAHIKCRHAQIVMKCSPILQYRRSGFGCTGQKPALYWTADGRRRSSTASSKAAATIAAGLFGVPDICEPLWVPVKHSR